MATMKSNLVYYVILNALRGITQTAQVFAGQIVQIMKHANHGLQEHRQGIYAQLEIRNEILVRRILD